MQHQILDTACDPRGELGPGECGHIWGTTNVHHILCVDCYIRTWGPAADKLLTVHLDGTSLALSQRRHPMPLAVIDGVLRDKTGLPTAQLVAEDKMAILQSKANEVSAAAGLSHPTLPEQEAIGCAGPNLKFDGLRCFRKAPGEDVAGET